MAISVLQTAHAFSTSSGSPITATFSSGITAGSIIAVAAEWSSNTLVPTFSDGKGDTITDSGAGIIVDSNGLSSVVQAYLTPTAGATSVSMTVSTQFLHLVIWEIAGYTSPAFDQVAQITGLNSNSVTTGTLSQSAECAITYASTSNASFTNNSLTINHGTYTQDYSDTVGGTASNQAGHSITSATTALTASITISFNYMTIWCVTFKNSAAASNPFLNYDFPNPFPVSWYQTWSIRGNLTGLDKLPNRQMDWPTPIGYEPNPRRSWEWKYNQNLIGKDRFFGVGGPDYDYLNRPMPGPEPDWRRSWEWSYNRNLIGQDKLPFRNDYLNRPLPNYIEPDWRRSWEFWYNLNLIGKDTLPNRSTDRPNPYPVSWYQTWSLNLLQTTLIPAPQKPISQYDWPLPQPVIWYRSWEAWYNQNLIGKDQLPFRSTDRPNPYPVIWYVDWNQNLAGFLHPPFNQLDWPVPNGYPPLTPSWAYSYNPNLIGKDKLPFNQKDWPNPQPVYWYKDWSTNSIYIIPVGPKPFNQQDWQLPGPIPFRDYGYINFTVNIPQPPLPPVVTTGGRDWRQYPESLSESFKRIHGEVLQAFDRVQEEQHIRDIALKLGSKGGQARAEALTAKQRTNIATKAAQARWSR